MAITRKQYIQNLHTSKLITSGMSNHEYSEVVASLKAGEIVVQNHTGEDAEVAIYTLSGTEALAKFVTETVIDEKIANAGAAAATEVVEGTDPGSNLSITSAAGANDQTIYTVNLTNVAGASAVGLNADGSHITTQGTYTSSATTIAGEIAALDTALAALDGAVENLDLSSVSGSGNIVVDVTQTNGQVAATATGLTTIVITGYSEQTAAEVAATDTLGHALGKLQGQIKAMDKDASAVAGQVVTTVSEADGVVSETKANLTDITLAGYDKSNDSGAITSADTLEVALSKIENALDAQQVEAGDGSITIGTNAQNNNTTVAVNIKSGEKVLATSASGMYTDIKIVSATPSSTNVKEEYHLQATDGTQLGESIKIYKDSSLYNVYLGNQYDTLVSDSDPTVVPGSGDTSLCFIYQKADGKYELVAVDVETFLEESEFQDGLQVVNHEVSVKVDSTSEKVYTQYNADGTTAATGAVLSVSSDGVKVDNIQTAIDAKVAAEIGKLDYTDTAVTDQFVTAVDEADGKITAVTRAYVSQACLNGYSKGSDATAVDSGDTLNEAISKLENQIAQAIVAGNTIVQTSATTHIHIASSTTNGQATYTISEEDIASASDLTDEIAHRKAVTGVDGDAYTANSGTRYISGATSLNNADVKLDAALSGLSDTVDALDGKAITGVTVNGTPLTVSANTVAFQALSALTVSGSSTDLSGATSTDGFTVNTGATSVTIEIAGIEGIETTAANNTISFDFTHAVIDGGEF